MKKPCEQTVLSEDLYELRFCGKLGKHVGCQQGCEEEYGTFACWECPDPNGPSHILIRAHENAEKAVEFDRLLEAHEAERQKQDLLNRKSFTKKLQEVKQIIDDWYERWESVEATQIVKPEIILERVYARLEQILEAVLNSKEAQ